MADDEPRAGELTTANYGWTKPNVGDSDDAWGGMINADLDGIDSTVKSVSNAIPAASSTTPVMSGAGAVGAGTTWARADHQHPSDTSRYAASNPSGYQTAAQVTAAVPVASSTAPVMDGIAAVGVGTTWARADHVHPTDVHAMGDNRIINGDCRIDQRWNGASGTATGYTIDRWQYAGAQASKGSWGRNSATALAGFPYGLFFTSSSAYASVTSDYFQFLQTIEADMVSDFAWGTSSAQPVTLSFWALSSLTGTFSGSIRNAANTRSYPFSFSLPTASAWTRIVITIPGDTGGTWVMNGNAGSVGLTFDLGSGATYRGSANAWASANYIGVTGSVSVVGTNGASLVLTGVKLEIGSIATPFNRQSLAKSLADCQRYYQSLAGLTVQGYQTAGGNIVHAYTLPTTMRAAPTIVFTNVSYVSNSSGIGNDSLSVDAFTAYVAATATGSARCSFGANLSAEL